MKLGQPLFSNKRRYMGSSTIQTGVVQRPYVQHEHFKPEGLWYSVGKSWWEWMAGDAREWWKDYVEVHVIEIDESRVLQLKTAEAVRKFHHQFKSRRFSAFAGRDVDNPLIDWREVEKLYAGIEIAPYQWGLRHSSEVPWYYPWDAASGCVWDVSAITRLEHIGTMDPLPPSEY